MTYYLSYNIIMLKVAIENSYTDVYTWKDEFWAKFFMQDFFYKNNIELVRVSINHFDYKTWSFKEYSVLDNEGKNITIKKYIIPDIIRSRRWIWIAHKYELLKDFIIVPSEKISTMSNDKFEIYKFNEKYQPVSSLLSVFFGKPSIQKTYKNKIVIKPIRANWGKWIVLTTTKDLIKNRDTYIWLEELFIVQEFKDFSKWCPWICSGNHDVRLMFAGNKIIETTLRVPKKWDFRSNIGAWWEQIPLKKAQLPNSLLQLAKYIYRDLHLQGNDIMSMDFAYCAPEKKRYLLEINASPWTWYYQTDASELKRICVWLVTFFTSLK